jgi:hypothetical protein
MSTTGSGSKFAAPKIHYTYATGVRKPVKSSHLRCVKAVAFSYDETTGECIYGASIFTRDTRSDSFNRAQIRSTALERFAKSPIKFTLPVTEDKPITCAMVLAAIHEKMTRKEFGCGRSEETDKRLADRINDMREKMITDHAAAKAKRDEDSIAHLAKLKTSAVTVASTSS